MDRATARLLALALGTLAGTGLSWLLWPMLTTEEPAAITFHDGSEDLAELSNFLGDAETSFAGAKRGALGHLLLTRPVADRLFGFSAQRLNYDPLTYFRRPPFQNARVKYAEHPDGEWWKITNSLGLRNDGELARKHPNLRVFVTGDSHTDGVCNNAETFSGRLEIALEEDYPSQKIEFWNAGVGGYSFYNYIGVFERYVEFDMDVFIMAVYGGNDFQNVVGPHMFFQGKPTPTVNTHTGKVAAALEIDRPSFAQCFLSYHYFALYPEMEELAVAESVRATLALKRRCAQEGVELIVAYIPTAYEVQGHLRADLWQRVRETLELDDHQMQSTQRQAARYISDLSAAGVEVVDLRPSFSASEKSLYWKRDHHINLDGHQLTADVLLPHVLDAWERSK